MTPDEMLRAFREWRDETDRENAKRLRERVEQIMRRIEDEALHPEPAVRLARCPICSGKGTIHLEPHALDDHDAP